MQAQRKIRRRTLPHYATGRTALWFGALLVLGGVYLAVNARLARAGRELLVLERSRSDLQRANAELSAALADVTAPDLMMERAAYLGFHPAKPNEVAFVTVEGYAGAQPFDAPRPPSGGADGTSMLSPAYTETLGEWLARWLDGGGG